MEHFWWALKYEGIKIKEYASLPQLRFGVQHYVNFYNSRRLIRHSNIGRWMKPISELAIGKLWDIVVKEHLPQISEN